MRVGTDQITIRVSAAETGGTVLAADVRMPAGGGPPLLHRHDAAEIYRVDAGELAIYLEDEHGTVTRRATRAGDVVHIPSGHAHTIRNESAAPSRAYVLFAPGDAMERFVHAAAALADPPAPEAVAAVARRHGVTFAGPLPLAPAEEVEQGEEDVDDGDEDARRDPDDVVLGRVPAQVVEVHDQERGADRQDRERQQR
ncbi:hypothetical protein DSM104299_04841 [Baekduia alba]|nr:hypothetical protein DSM104299_04841 [Baekduia alba]